MIFTFLLNLFLFLHFVDQLKLFGIWLGVDLCVEPSLVAELVIAGDDQPAGFLIEGTLRERNNQQAFNYLEDVGQAPLLRVPISFQGIYTDIALRLRDIWMEDLCEEVTFGWLARELSIDHELATEDATFEGRVL